MAVYQIKVHLAGIDLLRLRAPFLQSTLQKNQTAPHHPSIVSLQGNALLLLIALDPHQEIANVTDLLLRATKYGQEEGHHREIGIDPIVIRVKIIVATDILALALVLVLAPDLQRKEGAIALRHQVMTVETVESTDTQKAVAQVENEKEVVDAELHLIEVLSYCQVVRLCQKRNKSSHWVTSAVLINMSKNNVTVFVLCIKIYYDNKLYAYICYSSVK